MAPPSFERRMTPSALDLTFATLSHGLSFTREEQLQAEHEPHTFVRRPSLSALATPEESERQASNEAAVEKDICNYFVRKPSLSMPASPNGSRCSSPDHFAKVDAALPEERPPQAFFVRQPSLSALTSPRFNRPPISTSLDAREVAAALVIQRIMRTGRGQQRSRALLSMWPDLEALRGLYLDKEAIAVGARGSIFYSDCAIVARESLRSDAQVVEALEHAWEACSHGSGLLSQQGYMAMSRRIYLVLELTGTGVMGSLEPANCITVMAKDFAADSGGKDHLTRDDFFRCIFQLADLHIDCIDGRAYATWILMLVHRIARVVQIEPRIWEWRDDRAIMAEATAIPELLRRKRSSRNALERRRQPTSFSLRLAPIPTIRERLSAKDYPRSTAADALAHDNKLETLNSSALPSIQRHKSAVSVFDRLRWSSAFHAARLSERDLTLEHVDAQHRANDAKLASAQLQQTSMASLASSEECGTKKVSPSATRSLPHHHRSLSSETPKLDRKRPAGTSQGDSCVAHWAKMPSPPRPRRSRVDQLLGPRTRHLIAA